MGQHFLPSNPLSTAAAFVKQVYKNTLSVIGAAPATKDRDVKMRKRRTQRSKAKK